MRYAYYPGCSLHASAKEYDVSWKAVCERLDIELLEMEDWSCCGTVHATSVNRTLSWGLAARNLTIAESMDLEMVAPCSGCYKNLRIANESLKRDETLRHTIDSGLPRPFQGTTQVHHPLYVIREQVGLSQLAGVPRPLRGLKVAPHYGCALTRPAQANPIEDPEDPQSLDELLTALGADVVSYPAKTKCCGGAVLLSHTDIAVDLTAKLLKQAKDVGADCIAVSCPMCQMAMDAYQAKAEHHLGEQLEMPVLYFTQLMGLAMGIDERQLGLSWLMVSPAKVVAQV